MSILNDIKTIIWQDKRITSACVSPKELRQPDDYLVIVNKSIDKKSLKLIEPASDNQTEQSIPITHKRPLLVWRIDYAKKQLNFPALQLLLNSAKEGPTMMCDYILFYRPDNNKPRLVVLLCELKIGENADTEPQLWAGALWANYIVETTRRVFNNQTWLDLKVEYRVISFKRRSVQIPLGGKNLGTPFKENIFPFEVSHYEAASESAFNLDDFLFKL